MAMIFYTLVTGFWRSPGHANIPHTPPADGFGTNAFGTTSFGGS